MALTIFFRNGLTVAAKVDERGPRLEIYADGAELDQSAVESLIPILAGWAGDMKRLGICRECNSKTPLHLPACRQGPGKY